MAVTANKSTAITNRDASPVVLSNPIIAGGMLKEAVGFFDALSTDSIGSTYRFCQVPSNARISEILISSDDSGATGTMDIGLYQTTANGGAVVDADFFSTAVDIKTAALKNSDVTYGNAFGIEESEMALWQVLGLSSDPGISYDVTGTTVEVTAATTSIAVKARFVV